jgi:hypothetical protein
LRRHWGDQLIDVAGNRQAQQGQQTKMELAYQYLTGPRFRHRMDAIVEKFTDMRDDLDRERKLRTKREEQLKGVLDSSAGLYGDLQGIAGRAMEEIDGLDILRLKARLREVPPRHRVPTRQWGSTAGREVGFDLKTMLN